LKVTFNFDIGRAMVVCLCQGVPEKRVRACIAAGARTRQQVTDACGAGDGCGSCHRTIKTMIVEARRAQAESVPSLPSSSYHETSASSAVA
jgi:bacterioferritin-associated ferredoxin